MNKLAQSSLGYERSEIPLGAIIEDIRGVETRKHHVEPPQFQLREINIYRTKHARFNPNLIVEVNGQSWPRRLSTFVPSAPDCPLCPNTLPFRNNTQFMSSIYVSKHGLCRRQQPTIVDFVCVVVVEGCGQNRDERR
jgi:hypothetical protein